MQNSMQNSDSTVLPVSAVEHRLAVTAQLLYLLNITLLPVVGFVVLIGLFFHRRETLQEFSLQHFQQAIVASVVAGLLLVMVSIMILLLGGISSPYTWMMLILYFTCIHSALILFGVFGLTRATNDRPYRYPLIGRLWV